MPCCHAATIMSGEMTGLKCQMAPHLPDSRDLAITDFYLFDVLKQKMHGIDVRHDEELNSEIVTIFQGILSYEPKKSFDH
jgi:hypothetical protein